jgi:hypothetical protein
MLVQVDCGFVIWYRAQANRVSPSAELDRALRHHTRFLKRLLGAGRQRIVIAAAAAEADTTGTTTLAKRVIDHSFQLPLQIAWITTPIVGIVIVAIFH